MFSTTSSVDAVHVPFEMVQRRVALEPTVTPVTVDVREVGVVIVAVPLTTVHVPVPTAGLFAARVKFPLLQLEMSEPALAVVGVA